MFRKLFRAGFRKAKQNSGDIVICRKQTTEEKLRKIEWKRTGSDAILGTRKVFPLSLPKRWLKYTAVKETICIWRDGWWEKADPCLKYYSAKVGERIIVHIHPQCPFKDRLPMFKVLMYTIIAISKAMADVRIGSQGKSFSGFLGANK